ncbi:cysteine synthase family protein [Brooklawnia cerclae]|uniref:Cysteine synthase A n=1 Tax=Brooklawnia cerclae TaxID=349934 RepID=A0ABX0SK26_9ACTN|nr:cysteine synthase family protein [Brooklawnia cerclae]NIH57066.1 cysteine synthase A [Brooklawnia cerclae]
MSQLVTTLTDLIGDTPLLELSRYGAHRGLNARILAKLETRNPVGSVKDRIAWAIIRDAEERGLLHPGGEIVDVTSGNTGIALGAIAASRGYTSIFYASDNISPDKLALLRAFGARIVKVPNTFFLDPDALVLLRTRAQEENPGAFFADQLSNPVNPRFHYETTGPEIWQATDGQVDILVGGVGTGGTLSGAGRYLKEHKPSVRVVAAEPGLGSVPTPENPYPKEIDGVHNVTEALPQQLPDNLDRALLDEIVALETDDAFAASRALAREEGLLAGTSAGAIVHVATLLAQRAENAGKTIVVVIPDSGERYLSAGIYDDDDRVPAEQLVGAAAE